MLWDSVAPFWLFWHIVIQSRVRGIGLLISQGWLGWIVVGGVVGVTQDSRVGLVVSHAQRRLFT